MPRSLSLKKSQQSNGITNQKSITQFFKNLPISGQGSNLQKASACVNKSDPDDLNEAKCIKRKASSPVHSPSIVKSRIRHELRTDDIDDIVFKKCKVDKSITNHDTTLVIKNIEGNLILSPHRFSNKSEGAAECDMEVISSPGQLNNVYRDNKNTSPKAANSVKEKPSPDKKFNMKLSVKEKENCDHEVNPLQNNVNHVKITQKNNTYRNGKSPQKSPTAKATNLKKCEAVNNSIQHCSAVKALNFENDVEDVFGDEWDLGSMDEELVEDLDLSKICRCEILSIKDHGLKFELRLKNEANQKCTCFVEGVWLNTPLQPGERISILASRDKSGQFTVNNQFGLLILRPDHLISSTSVVAGVFCKRKAVLQERWRGIDSANTAMTIGILIHELVQKALRECATTVPKISSLAEKIIKDSIQMLFDAGITEDEATSNMQMYIGPLADFMQTYVVKNATTQLNDKDKWNGKIDQVLDIEENVCCPQLGLKGKIDATLQVTKYERSGCEQAVVPLELKSGRATMSAEHRGQLVLYGMMMSLQRGEDPATSAQRGLLLYLKERIDLKEVSCGYPERRDLMMLRNELVQHLAAGPTAFDPEQITDIEDAPIHLKQSLPEPVQHPFACEKCPYLTICSLHLWHTDGPKVNDKHPLSVLRGVALGHLSSKHIDYFLQWASLICLEEKGQISSSPLHSLWTETPEKRSKKGSCAANMKLKSVTPTEDRNLHVFLRNPLDIANKATNGPQEGEFSIVSLENRPWVAAGVVTKVNEKELHILLERDLSRRLHKDTVFHIDTYESYATTVQNLTNLGVLMEDSDRALRLRKLIIDKEKPEFETKLPRDVGRLGAKLMRALNIEQQRAVLRALAAQHYVLLKGLPGTGKTQTISVLIQMLVALKQRVLVTAHTHSAVDTVLSRLPESLRVMRLGSSSRVADTLRCRCEQALTANCTSAKQLADIYDSMEVVGVTCLGAAHAMLAREPFDVCIVDEATQVLQCTVLRPLFAAKRFVLVGDPEQLPPVVKSATARRLGMEESLFHRLMKEESTFTLRLQYRMNQALADIANKVAYRDQLKCANQNIADARLCTDIKKLSLLTEVWTTMACSPIPEDAAIFLDIETPEDNKGNDKNFANPYETCIVIALTVALMESGMDTTDIGVIAPYRDQVSLLRRELSKYYTQTGHHTPDVSTVDQFQGRDKSVIIYSGTRRIDHDDRKVKEGEILNDQRRLAVSVTRAKHKFILVGNLKALRRYSSMLRLINACKTARVELDVVNKLYQKYGNKAL